MPQVNIDLETASAIDLKVVGVHVYARHPSTRVLCMSYKIEDQETQTWWPGEPFPAVLNSAIKEGLECHAWSAAFERIMWPVLQRHHGAPDIPLTQWRCTMVRALLQGFPGALANAGPSMGLGVCKDDAGHRLMLQLCKPRQRWKPGTKGYDEAWANVGGGEYELVDDWEVVRWWKDPDRLRRLGLYCDRDVDTEYAAGQFLDPFPEKELAAWQLDQRINDRGFFIDTDLANKALALVKPATAKANATLCDLTSGELKSVSKPNDIRAWINREMGMELASIDKATLNDLLVTPEDGGDDLPVHVREVIELRLSAGKTSTAKLNTLLRGIGDDHRFRGGLQFSGAARTGRYAGRRFQPQNLPRPADYALDAIPWVQQRHGVDAVELAFGSALEVISAILRSCITAAPGHELIFADYNAIEVRMVAWLCGAKTLLSAFRNDEDTYRIMAAKIFDIEDWRSIGKEGLERFLGKTTVLGANYQMGAPRFRGSCKEQGRYISAELAGKAITSYRGANPEIPLAWKNLDWAAIHAMQNPQQWVAALEGKAHFRFDGGQFLRLRLPSGRLMSYLHPRLIDDVTPWGTNTIKFQFWGWDAIKNRMVWQDMFGGRWLENLSQAASRDVMQDAMMDLDAAGYPIILTVHDEVGAEPEARKADLKGFSDIMATPPIWAPDLPLKVEGWVGHRYRK